MVTSPPAGLSLLVDNAACTSPCTFQWRSGSMHTISAANQPGTTGTQYVFASWSDGGAASHTVTAGSTGATYTADYTTQYLLTTASSPLAGGTISPATGWYNAGSEHRNCRYTRLRIHFFRIFRQPLRDSESRKTSP